MPRKNATSARRSSNRGKRRRSAPKVAPIDWDRIEALEKGGESEPRRDDFATRDPFAHQTTTRKPKIRNEYARWLTGFSSEAVELILKYGLDGMDERGIVPVSFTGISQKPVKKIDFKKPSSVISRDGFVVISGVVGVSDVGEIGRGEEQIRQVAPPNLDGYSSNKRLNVSLGRAPNNFDNQELSGHLAEAGDLILSQVTSINGQEVGPNANVIQMEELWNRPEMGNPWRLGAW